VKVVGSLLGVMRIIADAFYVWRWKEKRIGIFSMAQPQQQQLWWHPTIKKLLATRPVMWIIPKTLHHLDELTYRMSDGKYTAASILSGLPIVTLTTTGAKSGKPRTVPLLGFPDGERLMFVASNWGQERNPSWYYNLRANPEATISIGGQDEKYNSYEATGAERELYWKQAVDTLASYAAYEHRANGRQIPIMVCVPKKNLRPDI
jgi:deazaflavin-dependent oxidoreductase (nitroreductase family)